MFAKDYQQNWFFNVGMLADEIDHSIPANLKVVYSDLENTNLFYDY